MNTITINWAQLGAKLAVLSDTEQSEFFKGFAFELRKYETHYARETQMFAVNSKLSEKDKQTLEESLSALWYKGE